MKTNLSEAEINAIAKSLLRGDKVPFAGNVLQANEVNGDIWCCSCCGFEGYCTATILKICSRLDYISGKRYNLIKV